MIYKLQRKFIIICTVSVLLVILLVFSTIFALSLYSMNKNLDVLADTVSAGGGKFPAHFPIHKRENPRQNNEPSFGFITPETPFATRHFTVLFDENGDLLKSNTDAIYSITDETAVEYANKVKENVDSRGWLKNYRYKVFTTDSGRGVVFIDGSMSRASLLQSLTISGLVLIGCAALVLLLIIILSKKAVKPIAESYEKQKQFITDANHELKTPLTLILANLDIVEAELGENEWFCDIRTEGERMTELVNQLVALSRMDEDENLPNLGDLSLSELSEDIASEFFSLSSCQNKRLKLEIARNITYRGDEALIRRLISILLDNAVKYCEEGGEILLKLEKHRRIALSIENTYFSVSEVELNRLFDRFYRADKARKFTGGYGIGLSIAKSIVEKHKGEISAYKKDASTIGFKVIL